MSFRKWNHPRVLVHLLVVRKNNGHHNFYVFLEAKSFDTSTLSQKHEEHGFTWGLACKIQEMTNARKMFLPSQGFENPIFFYIIQCAGLMSP